MIANGGEVMFGYVKPYVPELKIIENQYYQAAYCGLCRVMKKETGMLSRMTLSYDMTFLVLARLAVVGEIPTFEKRRCFARFLKKKLVMEPNDALTYASHASALLTMHKIADDITDEKGTKKLKALFMKLFFRGAYKKAKRGYEALDEIISAHLVTLRQLEREKTRSADRPAEIFGALMADIMTYGLEGEEEKRIARGVIMPIGRWIYLIDALDDIDEDRKKKSYNPFLLLFEGQELDREKKLDIEAAMFSMLKKSNSALDLVDFDGRRDLEGLMRNIITEGLVRMTDAVLFDSNIEKEKINENGDNQ